MDVDMAQGYIEMAKLNRELAEQFLPIALEVLLDE